MPKTFTASRLEISLAVDTIVRRITEGHSTTAIVMPPRTGKSDVIRAAALEVAERFSGVSVALSPWLFLRDQLINKHKTTKMCERLHIARYTPDKLETPFDWDFYLASPNRDLWSMTIAAAAQEAGLIQLEEVSAQLKRQGRLLVVHIDEGHLVSSEQAGWGKIAARLEAAGAHVVLLTGSKHRSDNIAPFGFRVTELTRQAVNYRVPGHDAAGEPIFQVYAAERVAYEMEADYEFSRGAAWTKGYLALIQARWFSYYSDGQVISAVKDAAAVRKALSKAVRDPDVIRQAAELLVDDVMTRRHVAPTSAAIIFVGNDAQNEAEDERHTNQVKNIIETVWRQKTGVAPIVVTAMQRGMKQDEAAARINRFVGTDEVPGFGDALIVKQMGGVGLDAGRIKTALDLSVIRTSSGGIQRWLRIATPWDDTNGKPLATNGTLIIPNDFLTESLYEYVVASQGGDLASLINKVRLEDEERDPSDPPPDPDISNPFNAGVTDLHLDAIGSAKDDLVSRVLRQQPKLALIYDRVEIARRLDSGQITITEDDEGVEESVVDDVSSDREGLYNRINELTMKYANSKCDYGVDRESWVRHRTHITSEAKQRAGIKGKTRSCHDVPRLEAMIKCLEMWTS
ncbi:MAG TPA: hypothetical protein VEW06_06265 [Xanthobacteraceae bacterium]|nr:hypothetical protein [Xanthobacteraceae bacterium]